MMVRGLLTLSIICIVSCKDEPKAEKKVINTIIETKGSSECEPHISTNKRNNLNISILLDLSDRIDEPQQQNNDSLYILSLAKSFNDHVKKKKLGLLYDKMEVFFEPAPSDPTINSLANQLKVSYVKGVSKEEYIPKTLERYASLPTQIYELARSAAIGKDYPGSDVWNFFKYQIKDYCIEDCRRNILVILTDGYMYHDKSIMKENNRTSYLTPSLLKGLNLNQPDWKNEMEQKKLGFIPATKNLEDLEVLVLGIQSNNDANPYAYDIIHAYWENWLVEMGVNKSNLKIKNADIPSNIEKVIVDFIQKK